MSHFKIGDKVICVNGKAARPELVVGETYTISDCDNWAMPRTVGLAEIYGRYVESRFVLAENYQNAVGKELTKEVQL